MNCTKAIVLDPKKLSFDPNQAIRAPQPAIPPSVRDRTAQAAVHCPSPLAAGQDALASSASRAPGPSSSGTMPPPSAPASATAPHTAPASGRPATFTVPAAPPRSAAPQSPLRMMASPQSPGATRQATLPSSLGNSRDAVPRSPSAVAGPAHLIASESPGRSNVVQRGSGTSISSSTAPGAARRLDPSAAAAPGSVFVRAHSPPCTAVPQLNVAPSSAHAHSPTRVPPATQQAGTRNMSPMRLSPMSSSSSSSSSPAIVSTAAALSALPAAAPAPTPAHPSRPDHPSHTPSPLNNVL